MSDQASKTATHPEAGLRFLAMRRAMGLGNSKELCRAMTAQLDEQFTPQSLWNYEAGQDLPCLGDEACAVLVNLGFNLPYIATGDLKHLPGDIAVAVLAELEALQQQGAMAQAA